MGNRSSGISAFAPAFTVACPKLSASPSLLTVGRTGVCHLLADLLCARDADDGPEVGLRLCRVTELVLLCVPNDMVSGRENDRARAQLTFTSSTYLATKGS